MHRRLSRIDSFSLIDFKKLEDVIPVRRFSIRYLPDCKKKKKKSAQLFQIDHVFLADEMIDLRRLLNGLIVRN